MEETGADFALLAIARFVPEGTLGAFAPAVTGITTTPVPFADPPELIAAAAALINVAGAVPFFDTMNGPALAPGSMDICAGEAAGTGVTWELGALIATGPPGPMVMVCILFVDIVLSRSDMIT